MTATLEQTQADLSRLLESVRRGEDVVITQHGQPVARLTGVAAAVAAPEVDRVRWMEELAELRRRVDTGKYEPSIESILNDDRGD